MEILTGRFKSTINALSLLAASYKDGPLSVADISIETKISVSYLEQLFASLRRANLISGVRGPGGGYILARSPESISLADVMACDEPQRLTAENDFLTAQHRKFLAGITLDRI